MRILAMAILSLPLSEGGRGSRGRGKGKNTLPFGNVDEYTLEAAKKRHPDGAHITKGSHWTQMYRLGFKILLVCIAEGKPRPSVTWYKDGAELYPQRNAHLYENQTAITEVYSKVEIDPAAMGDQGIYSCLANNEYGLMIKNFRCEYIY